jgi:Uri superfamily endonuclease
MTEKILRKGTYCLLINLKTNQLIQIGRKGKINFNKGCYVYVGSAMNSLEGRIRRHLRKDKKMHWHVDYLLDNPNSHIVQVFFSDDGVKHECDLATCIAEEGTGIQGFGCSDCKCHSHLIYFSKIDEAEDACKNGFKNSALKLKELDDLLG